MARWAKWVINMAVQGTPITGENWTTLGNGVLPTTMWQMTLEWFIFMGLYWYLENILSVGHGTAKGWCFCLESCRNGGDAAAVKTIEADGIDGVPQAVHQLSKSGKWVRPHDVQAEHERSVDFSTKGKKDAPRVRICNVHKVYPAIGGAPEKMAVKSVSFGVNEKECFGLLGHNGAGKTTLLNVLTGLFPATSGTAFVDEFRLDKDMSKIYAVMGVCPQHDILWGSLTGRQHVEFFGRLKGYSGDALAKMVDEVIKSVNLTYAEKRKCGGYSGGMKRRLSVANSIVGGPEIVYME
jgi:ABC-type polysaccharide/polyol phosphate transport system ATPase subunit